MELPPSTRASTDSDSCLKERIISVFVSQSCDYLDGDNATVVLYLISSDESSVFLRGQLAYLQDHGFRPVVGTRCNSHNVAASFDANVEIYNVPFTRNPSIFRDLRALLAVIRLIRKVRPHIVNASTPKAGFLGTLGAWCCRVPHRIYVVRGLRYEGFNGIKRTALKFLERLVMKLAHTVIFNSGSLLKVARLDHLLSIDRGEVLGAGSSNGIAEHRFLGRPDSRQARTALGLPASSQVIGYVGRLSRSKGIKDLVDIFNFVREQIPSVHLLVVGSLDLSEPIPLTLLQTLEDDPQILWLQQRPDVELIYPAMDLFVFPSYREGLPNAPLEAQLCEVPVIAYAATGTRDAISDQNSGKLLPIGDVRGVGSTTVTLLKSEKSRIAMGAFGSRWVSANFNQQRFWAELLAVYRRSQSRN